MQRLTAQSFLVALFLASTAGAESHLMRFADIHEDKIVFTYEGDLWLVSSAGGDAHRITNDVGEEKYAKFSPDGSQIAFTGNYDGGTDVYVMDARGGIPRRLTYYPGADNVLGWFPDGKSILFRSRRYYSERGEEIFKISVDGGTEERLNVDRAGLTAISPDGKQIAYNRISTEFRTWKRYQGGMAPAIWMGSLETGDYQKITDWIGTNSWPMWGPDGIYFTSDREAGTLNIYRYDLATKQATALTHYRDYDVRYPSIGPGAIVYQYAESLYVLDLKTGSSRKVEINIPTDSVKMRPWYVDATKDQGTFGLSPTGGRLVLETRGEILTIPAEQGEPTNLTHTSESREKNAAWSPDGKQIAFISDKTGEEQIYLVDQSGEHEWKQLSSDPLSFHNQIVWSPDSKWVLFSNKSLQLHLVDAATGETMLIDASEYDDGWERWGIQDYVWSPDSKWIAYTRMNENMNETVHLYSMETKKKHVVTTDWYSSWSPSFDPKGKYLYFLSDRTFDPTMGLIDQNFTFLNMARPYVLVLKDGEPSPFLPKDEPEKGATETKDNDPDKRKDGEKPKDAKKSDEPVKTVIDVGDFERRTVAVEGIPAGNLFRLVATEKGFCYLKKDELEFTKYQVVTDVTPEKLDLYYYDMTVEKPSDRESKKLIGGINNYHISADGKKLVYRSGNAHGIVDVAKAAKVGDGKIDLAKVKFKVDREAEYMQMFNEAWRVERDWFYDPGMHGVDWKAVGDLYRKFVPNCGNRNDLTYLIGEMIGELNTGHTYVSGGDEQIVPKKVATGLLGADFDKPEGAAYFRVTHIIPGESWDDARRSPLADPGCPVKEGDFLIAIDGEEVRTTDNVYRFLENKSEKVVRLMYNSKPSRDGAKVCRVRTIASETNIRYHEWVDRNREMVAKASGGKIGYLHIPDMGEGGLIEFSRAFYPQHAKQAMIIDERYNTGGFVGDMIIDRLERKMWALTQAREGKVVRNPENAFYGHFAVLINEDTGSNGEFFAQAIKDKGLAPVIGMRTWGGSIGIEAHEPLVDSGSITPPQFGLYDLIGRWPIEGHGVDPDIEVQNMPGDVIKGRDAQLEAAVANLMDRLAKEPREIPPTPKYPKKNK